MTLLKPPADLHERMSARLAARLQRREDIELIGSLLGVARETSELFMVAPEADALRKHSDTNDSDTNDSDTNDSDERSGADGPESDSA